MAQRVQLRRDTVENWVAVNPILAEAEVGWIKGTKIFKIGDGVTAWNSLEYANSTAADIALLDTAENFTATNVEGALAELFQSVSDGKGEIATAITGKGGTADGSDTFTELASAITTLPSGGGVPFYSLGDIAASAITAE